MIFGGLRIAARRLVRDWRFTLAAAFTLSLGVGANATVFTIVNQLSLRDLPFTDHDRVISLGSRDTRGGRWACRSATSRTGGPPSRWPV